MPRPEEFELWERLCDLCKEQYLRRLARTELELTPTQEPLCGKCQSVELGKLEEEIFALCLSTEADRPADPEVIWR